MLFNCTIRINWESDYHFNPFSFVNWIRFVNSRSHKRFLYILWLIRPRSRNQNTNSFKTFCHLKPFAIVSNLHILFANNLNTLKVHWYNNRQKRVWGLRPSINPILIGYTFCFNILDVYIRHVLSDVTQICCHVYKAHNTHYIGMYRGM